MERIYLKRTSRVLAGHLWVFSNELATSPKTSEPGSVVELRDRRDTFLGIGYINPHSLISIRILSRKEESIDKDFFRKRINNAIDYRERICGKRRSYRVVFSEGDLLPGLIVDKYDDCISIQFLTLGMEMQKGTVLEVLDEIFSPSAIVVRNDSSVRSLERLGREKYIARGGLDRLPSIEEGGIRFEVDPLEGQKTGFFLDQAENRARFAELIEGGQGLDLFCYDGAWGMHLAKKGATVTCVDNSETALGRARRNAELNSLSDRCTFLGDDVFGFLNRESSSGKAYDFIVLDPPAFVKSKAKVKDALRGYREVNSLAMKCLTRGGLLATSSCSYHVGKEMFIDMIRASARDAGRTVRLIEMRSQGRDHPILLSMPETEYLKCVFLGIS